MSLWTVQDVATFLGIPTKTVYRHTQRGAVDPLPAFKVGKHLRFRPAEVEQWLDAHRVQESGDDWTPPWRFNGTESGGSDAA